jgi:Putative MetA-pathway of phenol degradation
VSRCRWRAKNFLILIATIAALAAGLVCPMPLHGQCQSSDFPENGDVQAAPSRPTESSSADPIGTGIVETEAGFAHTWIAANSSQTYFSNMVKIGAWCNVEIRWTVNSFLSNTLGGETANGFGDNFLAGQYRFHRESKLLPSMSAGYSVKFDSANPIELLGSGYIDHVFMLMFDKTVGKTSVVANANYFVIGTGQGHFNEKMEWTLSASRPVYRKLGVIGEVYYDSHLNQSNWAYGNSTWGITYNVNPRLVFDGGAYVAFNRGPGIPGTSAFMGVSYAIGNLYRAKGWGPQQKREE